MTQSLDKWAQLIEGVQGEQGGVSIINEGRLAMWSNQEMKSLAFIHNDDVKCFHMDVQGSHKLIVTGHINFDDHVLIKRQWASKRMNAMNGMFKDEKRGNHRKQFEFVVESYACFQSFGVQSSMNVKSAIEKLHKITKEKEAYRSEQRRGSEIFEKNRSRRGVEKSRKRRC